MRSKRLLVLFNLCLFVVGHASTAKRKATPNPVLVRRAVGCLATHLAKWPDDYFREYGIKKDELLPGDYVRVSINTHKSFAAPSVTDEYDIVVYMKDGVHGALFEGFPFEDHDGIFFAGMNPYKLDREGERWEASEGFGGNGTYKVFSDEATKLGKTPHFKVKLVPGKCSVQDWEQ